jgi:hypothetical protein
MASSGLVFLPLVLPSPDSVEWHVENERRLAAIELQKRKVEDLELRRQAAHQQRSDLQRQKEKELQLKAKVFELELQARQQKLDDAARRLELQRSERLAAAEIRKEKKLAAVHLQREKRLAAIELQREKFQVLGLKEKARERDRLRKLDDDAARLELRKVKEQLEAARGEQSRLASLASVEQGRELWRLQDGERALKLAEQKRLQDEAGMRAGGAYKRPFVGQQATEPCIKRRAVSAGDGRSRYSSLVYLWKLLITAL